MASAVAVQRAARVLIARRRVSRRRESIATVQAFYRGCRARWALSTALEEQAQRFALGPHGSGGGSGESAGEGESGRATAVPSSLHGGGGVIPRNELLPGYDGGSMQVGMVTRRSVPMDADCPQGFGRSNLAAFLWESREEAYGPGSGAHDVDSLAAPWAPHSEGENRRSCWKEEAGDIGADENDGAVFELSTKAVVSTTPIRGYGGNVNYRAKRASCFLGERQSKPPGSDERPTSPIPPAQQLQPLPPLRWTPVGVAPHEALERALRCSTLIVSSPSFDSACARRLFSRIGRRPPSRPPSLTRGQTTADRQRTTSPTVSPRTRGPQQRPQPSAEHGEKSGEFQKGFCPALAREEEEEAGRDQTSRRHSQGMGLRHIMVVGESPIGDGGLSGLCSAVRHRCLPRLTTLVIGGPGCRVGPGGVMALAVALSAPGCSQLRNLVSKKMAVLGASS